MVKFGKLSCGCIATEPVDGECIIVKDCQNGDVLFCKKPTLRETWSPLSHEANDAMVNKLYCLIVDGQALRTVRSILK